MIFKITGAIMIVLGTTFLGYFAAMRPYKRYRGLIKIDTGLGVMENEIAFTNELIDEVLINVSKASGINEIFKTCAQLKNGQSIERRWRKSVREDAKSLFLTEEDCETISMLAGQLGMTERTTQIKNIRHVRELLKGHINDAYEEYLKNSKMIKGLGITGGLFLAILLM